MALVAGAEGVGPVVAGEAPDREEAVLGATCAPPCWCCSPNSRATATTSSGPSRIAATGRWTRGWGSIYPTLQSLEDEGLITIDTVDGRKTASLTEEGVEWVAGHTEAAAAVFASEPSPEGSAGQIRAELAALRDAAMHVARHQGTDGAGAKAVQILSDARKAMYGLLAGDDA